MRPGGAVGTAHLRRSHGAPRLGRVPAGGPDLQAALQEAQHPTRHPLLAPRPQTAPPRLDRNATIFADQHFMHVLVFRSCARDLARERGSKVARASEKGISAEETRGAVELVSC